MDTANKEDFNKKLETELGKLLKCKDFKEVKNNYDMDRTKKLFEIFFFEENLDYEKEIESRLKEYKEKFELLVQTTDKNAPYPLDFLEAIILYTRFQVIDQLLTNIEPSIVLLREKIKGKEPNDPYITGIFQLFFGNISMKLGRLQEIELSKLAKEYDLKEKELINSYRIISSEDISIFLEVESLYGLKKACNKKDEIPLERSLIIDYLKRTIELSNLLLDDKINIKSVHIFPHIQNNMLFNEFGLENSEILFEIINILRQIAEYKTEKEFIYLVLHNIFIVEKARLKTMQLFEMQMMMMQSMMGGAGRGQPQFTKEQLDLIDNMMKNGALPQPTPEQISEMQKFMMGGMPNVNPPKDTPPQMNPTKNPTDMPSINSNPDELMNYLHNLKGIPGEEKKVETNTLTENENDNKNVPTKNNDETPNNVDNNNLDINPENAKNTDEEMEEIFETLDYDRMAAKFPNFNKM